VRLRKQGGHIERRARSRHIVMKKAGSRTTLSIPEHKVLDRGLLRALIRDAYLSVDEFYELLKRAKGSGLHIDRGQ